MTANRFKFRVWDNKLKMLFKEGCLVCPVDDFFINGDGELYKREPEGYVQFVTLDERYIISYSTGLTDKNGKEIFEGDIIEIDKPHPSYKHKEKGVIEFGDHQTSDDYYASEAYGYFAKIGEETKSLLQICQPFEIIGNKFENPELLEGNDARK